MRQIAQLLGPMRLLLYATLAIFLPMALVADTEPEGIGVLYAYIAPSVIVLFFFVLMLDALMNRIFMAEQTEEARYPHRIRLRADLLAVGALLLAWGPFYVNLVRMYSD